MRGPRAIIDLIRRIFGGEPSPAADVPGNGTGAPEMATCEEALARIQEYLDGELGQVSRQKVAEHFRICARCYPHLAMEESYRQAMRRALQGAETPPRVRERLLSVLDAEARGG